MKKRIVRKFSAALFLLAACALWTAGVLTIDVQPIGPGGSKVGFAAINGFIHQLTGVHMTLYVITDWLGLLPVTVGLFFAVMGLMQWIRRKKIGQVDADILLLGLFYLLVILVYVLFEMYPVNHRPVLISGYLETSYPSSTTLLVMCVMPTAAMQLQKRIQNLAARKWVTGAVVLFTVFMVAGRLLCGVHWLSDIVGGGLVSGGLVCLYAAACDAATSKNP